jgi:hypothetical protein
MLAEAELDKATTSMRSCEASRAASLNTHAAGADVSSMETALCKVDAALAVCDAYFPYIHPLSACKSIETRCRQSYGSFVRKGEGMYAN